MKASAGKTLNQQNVLQLIESSLFVVCLCVLSLRSTFTESPYITAGRAGILGNDGANPVLSSVLIFSFLLWLVSSVFSGNFSLRFGGMGFGIAAFFIAAIVACFAASNRRSAINDFVAFGAVMLAGLLLVRIFRRPDRVRAFILVLLALAAVSACQCIEQFFSGNKELIEDYEKDPVRHLAQIGAEHGSLKHFQYEHRLYSKDICGFLTTGNSTGSFLLLAVFSGAGLWIERLKSIKTSSPKLPLLIHGLAVALALAGLLLTKSKGAITAAVVSALVFFALLFYGSKLRRYAFVLLFSAIVAIVAVSAAAVLYGLKHQRLPGGNSMLVRWQYWQGAAEMYADNPVTGVGGANFGIWYPRYKIAAAPETVRDPHNFILSILCQYGPLGLAGFTAIFLVPILRIIFSTIKSADNNKHDRIYSGGVILVCISAVMLFARPAMIAVDWSNNLAANIYVAGVMFIFPAAIFALVFGALHRSDDRLYNLAGAGKYVAVGYGLFCGILAVAVHNIIDFAIFEPAVLTTLFFCLAAFVSVGSGRSCQPGPLRLNIFMKALTVVIAIAIAFCVLNYALVPVVRANIQSQKAAMEYERTAELFEAACRYDAIDPSLPALVGKLYMHQYSRQSVRSDRLLKKAEDFLLQAAAVNRADFKNYESLCDLFCIASENAPEPEKEQHLQKALDYGLSAVERYGGSDRLHFKLAVIAGNLKLSAAAIEHYRKCVEIEDAYRRQFRIMYPDLELFSRLGQQRYDFAKEKLQQLQLQ